MDIEKIRSLLDELAVFMKANDLAELELDVNGAQVKLRKTGSQVQQQVVTHHTSMPASAPPAAAQDAAAPEARAPEPGAHTVTSPMVGTFYRAPKPDTDTFVEVNDVVDEDTVLCIIEAMKVMNEIKAEHRGRVTEVLVENGEPVEYGQPLFVITAEP